MYVKALIPASWSTCCAHRSFSAAVLAGIPLSLLTIAWAVIGILLTRSVPSLGLLSIATVVALYLTAALCTHSEVAEFILADVGAGFVRSRSTAWLHQQVNSRH